MLQFEFRLRFHRISAAAQARRIFCFELLDGVAKLGRFVDSTGSKRFGEEIQDFLTPLHHLHLYRMHFAIKFLAELAQNEFALIGAAGFMQGRIWF